MHAADMTKALIWTYNNPPPNSYSGLARLFGNPQIWVPELTAGYSNLSVNLGYPLFYHLHDMFHEIAVNPTDDNLYFWDGAREKLELAHFIYWNSTTIKYHFAPPPSTEASDMTCNSGK
jgi:hypothetical protein